MNILIAGASGFVGQNLSTHLKAKGNSIFTLTRNKEKTNSQTFHWQPSENKLDEDCLKNIDIVINLAGEGIASKYWTEKQKKEILNSRVQSTKCLVEAIKKTSTQPRLFINASATGIYKGSEAELLNENSDFDNDFLATVCKAWEEEASEISKLNIRTVHARFGIIFGKDGGILKKMLLPFKLCLGGKLGNGKQFMSWISINDAVRAIDFIIENENIAGPVNLTSPHPITNENFTKTLATSIKRPAFLHVPQNILKYALGEMADELLLKSAPVIPQVLLDNNFEFKHECLRGFLDAELA